MIEILVLMGFIAFAAYWWDTLRSNELAYEICQKMCSQRQVQLLDSSVVRQRVWLRKTPASGIQLGRFYVFEYTTDGVNRQVGYIVLLGRQVVEAEMGLL